MKLKNKYNMKKKTLTAAAVLSLAATVGLTSCIGNFTLTHRVLNWNKQVGPKFVNELVFFAFWIVPVYEVTAVVDLLVLNSIEFWSGNNPMEATNRTVETDRGVYHIASTSEGYTIECPGGEIVKLDYDGDSETWAVEADGKKYPFMTMVDEGHVKMITPEGDMRMVELSEQGLQAYTAVASASMAQR